MRESSDQRNQINTKFYEKYKNEQNFQEELEKQEEKYHLMRSEAYISELGAINEQIISRFDLASHQVYFFYASMYDSNSINVHKLALFFALNFNPKYQQGPEKPYSFVFFNQNAKVDVYGQVKSIFLELTFKHYLYLRNIYLIRPSFYHKAQDFITYNYIPSFIKSKTLHLSSAKELCKSLEISEQNFVDFVPNFIADLQFPNLKPRNLALPEKRINFQGQIMSEEQRENRFNFEKDMKAFLFVKPGKQVYNIEDYELSKLGIPVILQLLIFYFKTHPEGLLLEGLFRKSVSIDEENQTLNELINKNYDCLLQVKNPHIVANLIKRFFANLKTPAIPYPQFQKLMHDQGVKNKKQYVKDIINSIPEINYLSIMFVIGFFLEHVIPNEPHNKMTAQNIAICFAPCLMRAEVSGPADLIYASKCMSVNKILIEDFDYVFGGLQERTQKLRKSEKEMIKQFEMEVSQSILCQKEKKQKKVSPPKLTKLTPPKTPPKQKSRNKSREDSKEKRKEKEKQGLLHKIQVCPTKLKEKCIRAENQNEEIKKQKKETQQMKNIDKYRRTQIPKSKVEFKEQKEMEDPSKDEKLSHRNTTTIRYIRKGEKRH